ncbi:MAG: twin-arginine translocase TatA/TatE family subunit [Anaerolineales bacterium]|nr:twin-arginine translocase TatA/TatE family subunit [Anaerolineales bacterium]MCB8961277.1 twin-arginine translocase TatA/TatE family subunit [Ardenticatenales bacterium]
MDSFFGIGLSEFAIILILAIVVMGPQRMRSVARTLGRWTAQLQQITRGFTQQLNAELDAAELDDLRGAMQEVQELRRQVADMRSELLGVTRSAMQEGNQAVSSTRNALAPQRTPLPENGNTIGQPEQLSHGDAAGPSTLPKAMDVPDDPES